MLSLGATSNLGSVKMPVSSALLQKPDTNSCREGYPTWKPPFLTRSVKSPFKTQTLGSLELLERLTDI